MFKFFNQKKKEENLVAPLTGKVISLEEVPDPVFSKKMMGDGLAIIPEDGLLLSPVKGKVLQILPTKHAIAILSDYGAEILIHIGLETVSMKGEGFNTFVQAGDKVVFGQKLISFDIELIEEKAKSIVTSVIITNGEYVGISKRGNDEFVNAGSQRIITLIKK